ncbi:MAG: hypothetical protein E7539_03470 [Ruminococcaceae bacterium]|nr:hypothetical protein [Oscillospiraceae bacterium]
MNKYQKFIAKHKMLATLLYAAIVWAVEVLWILFLVPSIPFVVLVVILSSLIIILHINNCQLKPHNAAIKMLDNYCDPMPLYEITEFLLGCKNNKSAKLLFTFNHCVALQEMGKAEQAIETIKALKIEKQEKIHPQFKCVYYHNLSSLYTAINEYVLADEAYNNLTLLYNNVKNKKLTKLMENPFLSSTALYYYRNENYNETIATLEKIPKTTLRPDVHNALLYARTYLKLGDIEKAKDKLIFVIANGNKLASVNEARELLKQTPYSSYLNVL